MSRKIKLTGEHTIDSIIGQEYGGLSIEEIAEKKAILARLNPHIVSLETFQIGDDFYLEDDTSEESVSQEEKLVPDQIDLSDIAPDTPTDETVHVPAARKRRS